MDCIHVTWLSLSHNDGLEKPGFWIVYELGRLLYNRTCLCLSQDYEVDRLFSIELDLIVLALPIFLCQPQPC